MKNGTQWKIVLLLCAALLACALAAGCGSGDEGETPSQAAFPSDEVAVQPEADSGFLAAAQPVEGSENLSVIQADFLDDGDYSAALQLGENLLLIRMYVSETDSEPLYAGDGEWYYEENFCYQFDLYSLEENAVVASLNTEERYTGSYQIVGSELFLVDYEGFLVHRYDETLTYVDTYDVSAFIEDIDFFFYPSGEEGTYYLMDYEGHSIKKALLSGGVCTLSDCEIDYYCSVINMASPDSSRLLLLAVDRESFRTRALLMDAADLTALRSYERESFSYGLLSDQALLAWVWGETDLMFCDWFDGSAAYFALPEGYNTSLLGGYVLTSLDTIFDDEAEEQSYRTYAYDRTGACVSAARYPGDTDGDGESDVYIASDPVYFEKYNCCLTLVCGLDGGGRLLVWDLSVQGEASDGLELYSAAEDVPSSEEDGADDGSTVTNIPDRDGYDWGALSDVRERANALEDACGISIYLGPEVPSCVGSYGVAQCLDGDALAAAMDALEEILALYPENFFSQLLYDDLQGIRIYLTGAIRGDAEGMLSDPSGYVENINNYMVMVLDTEQFWNWDYTVNHEISHMIDRRLAFRAQFRADALFSEEAWNAYNPAGFSYLQTYDGYDEAWDWDWSAYFVDSYGITYPTEDRAELFGMAMSDYLYDGLYDYLFTSDSVLTEKLRYYCACIRDGFDTAGWSEVMPWEKYVTY